MGDSGSESDDVFPSVGELAAKTRVGKRTVSVREDAKVKNSVKKSASGRKILDGNGEKEGKDLLGKGRVVGKRRVLNQRSDNPLLRPFDSASSGLIGEGSRRKGRAVDVKAGKKSVEENREVLDKVCCGGNEGSVDKESQDTENDKTTNKNYEKVMESTGPGDSEVSQLRRPFIATKSTKAKQNRKTVVDKTKRDLSTEKPLSKMTPVECVEPTDDAAILTKKTVKAKQLNKRGDGQGKEFTVSEDESLHCREPLKGKQAAKRIDGESRDSNTSGRARSTSTESDKSENEKVGQTRTAMRGRRKTVEKTRSKPTPQFEFDEEDVGISSDGMSDFVVDDSESLSEEESVLEEPAPRSVRRLVKGRKPDRIEDSDDEDFGFRTGNLQMEEDATTSLDKALKGLGLDDSDDNFLETKPKTKTKRVVAEVPKMLKNEDGMASSSDIEDPFTLR